MTQKPAHFAAFLSVLHRHTQDAATGLLAGTLITCADGEIPIEFLTPGDRIVTRAHGFTPLARVSAMTRRTHIVDVAPYTFSKAQRRSALLPAAQHVLLRGSKAQKFCGTVQGVRPVGHLVDGYALRDLGERDVRLITLQFARPEVIYADGVEIACTAAQDVKKAA